MAREILICEQDGDQITHEVIRRLNQTFVTPIDREDVLRLTSALDDIVDYIEEVADYLGLYRIEAPMVQAQALAHVLARQRAPDRVAIPLVREYKDITQHTSRSTASRTRATGSCARRSPRCSRAGSTRWW